jgi:cell division protein FtsL
VTRQLLVLKDGFLHWRAAVRRIEAGDLSFAVVAVTIVFGSLLGIVVLQTFIVQNRVELDAITRDLRDEQELNQHLRLAVIELEAPDRIMKTAGERLGMVRPTERRYVPGIDPALSKVEPPPETGDPFAPAPLPEHLGGTPDEEHDG